MQAKVIKRGDWYIISYIVNERLIRKAKEKPIEISMGFRILI